MLELALSIAGLVLGIILWLVKPEPVKKLVAKAVPRGVDQGSIEDLESKGLAIENKELLYHDSLLRKKRRIYWPVTPTDSPNLIHATFVRFLEDLSRAGLETTVFVFDYYYKVLKGKSEEAVKQDMVQFIDALSRLGLSNCRYRVVYESAVLKSARYNKALMFSIFDYLGSVRKGNIDTIAQPKDYIDEGVVFLRYLKPLFNMLYLSVTSKDYGFTLSGYDEQILWKTYHSLIGEARDYKLTNLYIPTMRSTMHQATHVWDKTTNITSADSRLDIREKVEESLSNPSAENGALYALKYVHFSKDRKLAVSVGRNQIKQYSSVDDLIYDVVHARIPDSDALCDAITEVLYELFHGAER
jgi:hypothetical protein